MKIAMRLVLFSVIVSLSACTVETTGPGPDAVEPTITRGSVETDYTAPLDGQDQFVICQDEDTRLTYTFTYTGDLNRWTSYLQGVTTSEEKGREEFTLSSENIRRDGNTVTVTYLIRAEGAPLLTEGEIDTQGIVVVPEPKELGATQLFLEVEGFDGLEPELLSADPIPVITNCPEQSDAVELTNASYESEFKASVEGETRSVICNDRPTEFSYSFDYSGNLENWSSYFEGETTGQENGRADLTINSGPVSVEDGRVTVSYLLNPNSAPTQTEPVLETQGIVVSPTLEGETRLYIVTNNGDEEIEIRSDPIPVMSTCPAVEEETVEITGSDYTTNFTTTIDGESRAVICNDQTTNGTVTIDYEGDLETLELYYQGVETGDRTGTVEYNTPEQIRAIDGSGLSFRFTPDQAPQFTAGGEPILTTQGIVITPEILGETQFFVRANGVGEFQALDFEIPVAATCN